MCAFWFLFFASVLTSGDSYDIITPSGLSRLPANVSRLTKLLATPSLALSDADVDELQEQDPEFTAANPFGDGTGHHNDNPFVAKHQDTDLNALQMDDDHVRATDDAGTTSPSEMAPPKESHAKREAELRKYFNELYRHVKRYEAAGVLGHAEKMVEIVFRKEGISVDAQATAIAEIIYEFFVYICQKLGSLIAKEFGVPDEVPPIVSPEEDEKAEREENAANGVRPKRGWKSVEEFYTNMLDWRIYFS